MRKPTVASLAVAAVISAGAGAGVATASAAAPVRAWTSAVERVSPDRHSTRATRDRSGIPARKLSTRQDGSPDRADGMKAGR
jgi:hypothetical protein